MLQIVLIDDDQIILMGIEKVIRSKYQDKVAIYSFLSPEEVLAHTIVKKADLIITDITMGEMSGLHFLKEVQKLNSSFESIVISAHHDFKYAQQSINLKVLSYLTKPVDFKALLTHVDVIYEKNSQVDDTNHQFPEIVNFLLDYIEDNYMKNITLKSISDEFHYNSSYLGRTFTKHLNKSFNLYLQETRINASKKMLAETNYSVDDISYMVGFPYSSYFSTTFKEFTGLTPLKYKQQLTKINS